MKCQIKIIFLVLCVFLCVGCRQIEQRGCLRFFIDGVPSEEELARAQEKAPKRSMVEIIREIETKEAAKWQSKHKPWEEGKCVACHNEEGGGISSGRIDTTCFKCHKKEDFRGKLINLPVFLGRCDICHVPHQSQEKALMREPAVGICLLCHPSFDGKYKFVQGKGSEIGSCVTCHRVHAGNESNLLKGDEKEVCMQCHKPPAEGETREANIDLKMMYGMPKCVMCHKKDIHDRHLEKGDMPASQNEIAQDYAKWRAHPPFEKSECKKCHNFSDSATENNILIAGGVAKTCLECHDKDKFSAGEGEKIHMAVMMGCQKCHSGHKTDEQSNLKKSVLETCGQCHKDVAQKFSHFPPEKGDCASCHNPHGKNKDQKYLKGAEKEVCMQCHKPPAEGETREANIDLKMMYGMPKCVMCHKAVIHGKSQK